MNDAAEDRPRFRSQQYRTATRRLRDTISSTDVSSYLPPQREGFVVAYGWHRQVLRTSLAADKLALAGFGAEAGPLRRSMIEHSAFLIWLADDEPAALAVLSDATIKTTKDLVTSALKGGYSIEGEPEWLSTAELTRHSDTYLGKVAHLLPKYGLDSLDVPWRIETSLSHPSKDTANLWWDDRDGNPRPRDTPTTERGDDATPAVALLTVYYASLAFHGYLDDRPWAAELAEAADRFGLPSELPARLA